MFVELTRGRSFKGLAQYCLHDADRKSDERVAFVETRNLATEDPQVAWRIMAARHYLQEDLKHKAGVGQGGAKDGKPVGHLLISWRKDEAEAEELDHFSMISAANGALRAIGACQHQAMIIGHTDTEHPHCHVIVNLIGDDGRLKKNWKEKQKLSKFALKYEIDKHGEPFVKTREKNWLDRDAGESPAPVKKKPRHLYELEKAAKTSPEARAFAQQHLKQLADLEKLKRRQAERNKKHQERLKWCHEERLRRTQVAAEARTRASKTAVRKAYRQPWQDLLNRQEAQRRHFELNEKNLKGSLSNAMQLINWKQLLQRKRQPDELGLSDAFRVLTSEATRREVLKKRQEQTQQRLRDKQRAQEQELAEKIRLRMEEKLRRERQAFGRKLQAMRLRQGRLQKQIQHRQNELTDERNQVLKVYREQELLRKQQLREQKIEQTKWQAVEHEPANENILTPAQERPNGRIRRPRKERLPRPPRERTKTRPMDLLPQDEKAPQIAQQIDDFHERMQQRWKDKRYDRNRDRGDRDR